MFAIINPISKVILEYPINSLRVRYPHMSFPRKPIDATLPSQIVVVKRGVEPATTLLQVAVESAPTLVGSVWVTTWTIRDKTTAENTVTIREVAISIANKVSSRLDAFANEKQYDSIGSACSYASSTIPLFAAEGTRALELRDQTWLALKMYYNDIEGQLIPLPETEEDILATLPLLTWV